MLSFVSNNIAKAVSVNTIQEEVNVLLDTARNDIALFEAVEEWLANELGTLPVIEEGEVRQLHTGAQPCAIALLCPT